MPTKDNPARIASRGIGRNQLIEYSLWWRGPAWLNLGSSQWPSQPNLSVETAPEARKPEKTALLASQLQRDLSATFIESFSDLKKLNTAAGWLIWLFQFHFHKEKFENRKIISANEFREAEKKLVYFVQRQSFPEEIKLLSQIITQYFSNLQKTGSSNPTSEKN